MKLVKKFKEETGSITMTVIAAMLFMTAAISIAYFSLSNQSNDQGRKIKQTANSYNVGNNELTQKYKETQDELNDITTMTIEEVKALSNYMIGKKTNTLVIDKLSNTFIVPAGFMVTNDADDVTEGMVIQDKDGNEFVWIPVGDVKYVQNGKNSVKTINLARYYFDNSGEISSTKTDGSARKPSGYNSNYTEDQTTSYENATSKNIEEFLLKTREAKGFYIGRYEARIVDYQGSVATTNTNQSRSWTGYTGGHLVLRPNNQVFNYITQNKASELSINMYPENNNYQSDLVNSYAWDTATLFLQEFDNRTTAVKNNTYYNSKYSRQGSLDPQYANKVYPNGTSGSGISAGYIDKICNVYDMAVNCFEWTTETCNNSSVPCVKRGAIYNSGYTSFVSTSSSSSASATASFRPILYLKDIDNLVDTKRYTLAELNSMENMSIDQARQIGNYMLQKNTNTTITDKSGNTFVLPSGFIVTNDTDNVTEGMVVQDKEGNEFVWIPVGDVKYIENGVQKTKTINLKRYVFNEQGEITSGVSGPRDALVTPGSRQNYKECLKNSTLLDTNGNAIAKDIEQFIQKTTEAKGYFIGRYEARKNIVNNTSVLVEMKNKEVYNNVSQNEAATIARSMYSTNDSFESDLMNAFAWDTAILFLQEFGKDNYSNETSKYADIFETYGTEEQVCNIYDMPGNCYEWTTETFSLASQPCVTRGGCYSNTTRNVKFRLFLSTSTKGNIYSFRPILYLK